jgi:succinate dehydrogenase/fumarate reductase-like Fe-S protein
VSKLCDFPVAKGKTCDAGMCGSCATNIGPDQDYCPTHKDQKPAAQQGVLFLMPLEKGEQ